MPSISPSLMVQKRVPESFLDIPQYLNPFSVADPDCEVDPFMFSSCTWNFVEFLKAGIISDDSRPGLKKIKSCRTPLHLRPSTIRWPFSFLETNEAVSEDSMKTLRKRFECALCNLACLGFHCAFRSFEVDHVDSTAAFLELVSS